MLKQNTQSKGIQLKIGRMLSFVPLSPNQWTVVAVLVAVFAAYEIAIGELVAGLALFAVAGALDMIDGAVARARKQVTKFGGFLDGISDRIVEALFLFSMMFYPLPDILINTRIWLALLVFLGTCMPSYVRAYADHNQVISHEKAKAMEGVFERSERIILIVLGVLAGLTVSMEYFVYAVILAVVLSAITVIQRIIIVMRS